MAATTAALARRRERLQLQLEVAQLQASLRAYEAAEPSQYHARRYVDHRSADAALERAGATLRSLARYLDENHDIAVSLLDDLVDNIIGTGITVMPMVRTRGGDLADDVNEQIARLREDWEVAPEVTGELPWAETERLACRSMFRDGEVFAQHVLGPRGDLDHQTRVPYSLELIEADLCPHDLEDPAVRLVQGIQHNAWGRPVRYHFYLEHPGDSTATTMRTDTKAVPAGIVTHLKVARRIRQTRGVSIFHAVISRLEDLKDLEESKRIQERVAASFSAMIRKGDPTAYNAATAQTGGSRTLEMAPGMIFDDLLPGEDVSTLGANRPGSGMFEWRQGQIRAACGGTGTKASSVSRDYAGSYSSQRQELVEAHRRYLRWRGYHVAKFSAPAHRNLIEAALLSGALRLPRGIDPDTLYDADYQGPAMPWVQPKEEVEAVGAAIEIGITSTEAEIRKRGDDPRKVRQQRARERREEAELQQELGFGAPPPADQVEDDPNENDDEEEAA